jgi:uncharacterized protein (DUF2062 family)
MNPVAKARARARVLMAAVLNERASPRQICIAVVAGSLVGLTPAVGFHGGLAIAVATALRVNRLWAFVGSRVSNPLTGPPIIFAQIQIAHRIRTGTWHPIALDTVVAHAPELLLDWMIGLVLVGGPLSLALGLVAFAWARGRAVRSPAE